MHLPRFEDMNMIEMTHCLLKVVIFCYVTKEIITKKQIIFLIEMTFVSIEFN
jgi:hypothetical protein